MYDRDERKRYSLVRDILARCRTYARVIRSKSYCHVRLIRYTRVIRLGSAFGRIRRKGRNRIRVTSIGNLVLADDLHGCSWIVILWE